MLRAPPTIQALLAARLDRSTPKPERAVIERAAVGRQGLLHETRSLRSRPRRRPTGCRVGARDACPQRPDSPQGAGRGDRTTPSDTCRSAMPRTGPLVPRQSVPQPHERFGRWLTATVGDRATEYEEGRRLPPRAGVSVPHRVGLPRRGVETDRPRSPPSASGAAGRRALTGATHRQGLNLIFRAIAPSPAGRTCFASTWCRACACAGRTRRSRRVVRLLTDAVEGAATTGNR